MFSDLVNIACAHREEQVSALGIFQKEIFDGVERAELVGGCSQGFDLLSKGIGADA